jgi:hypothetical protein
VQALAILVNLSVQSNVYLLEFPKANVSLCSE